MIRHYWDVRGGAVLTRFFGHSYAQLVPRELFATHPDWFALIRGERQVEALDGYWNAHFTTQFCTSNPEAVQHVIRTVEQFFEQNPDYQTFGLIPVDGGSWCECASCQAQDRPPRGHAGRVIALANAVAEAIHPRFPDKEILVLAYADRYLEPPEGLEIHPNVQMTPNGRFGGSLDLRESSAMQRFDAVAYRSAGVFSAPAGTVELWMRPDARARFVARGTFLDAGELTFSAANNVLAFKVKALTVTFDMNSLLERG